MGVELQEADFREMFDNISKNAFIQAMRIAKNAALTHSGFQHYMMLDKLKKMIENRSMWLCRLDNPKLNDWHEFGRYGSSYDSKRCYIGCFSYGRTESAAMWKMYCQPTRNAVRILISRDGMLAWSNHLKNADGLIAHLVRTDGEKEIKERRRVKIKCAGFSDVLYVCTNENDENVDSSGCVRWNGCCAKIEDLREWTRSKGVEGFVKDLEWQYEQETRLFVILKNEQRHATRLSLSIPDVVFNSMSIVLSPWLPEERLDSVREEISSWFEDAGLNVPRTIRPSRLTNAVWAWTR